MVFITRLVGAALLLSSIVSALPTPPMQEDPAKYEPAPAEPAMSSESPAMGHGMQSETTAMAHETTSVMAHETTSVMAHETSSSPMHEATTSAMAHETTTTAAAVYSIPAYGSGSSDNSAYNDCVQRRFCFVLC